MNEKEWIISKYIKKLEKGLISSDNEESHGNYDQILEELIKELGYQELIDYANKLIEERDIVFWYA